MDKKIGLVVMFFPLFAFVIAAIAEIRFRGGATLVRVIAPVLGMAAAVLYLFPHTFFVLTVNSSAILSSIMTVVSAAIASSGVFVTYSRRSTGVWVAVGGLLLTVLWMGNRVRV